MRKYFKSFVFIPRRSLAGFKQKLINKLNLSYYYSFPTLIQIII